MEGKCTNQDCAAPITQCLKLWDNLPDCEYWKGIEPLKEKNQQKAKESKGNSIINWSGDAFSVNELSLISLRNSPIIIGLVGRAGAGKSSFLGMLYTLFLNGGRLKEFNFAGTKTITGWESLAHRMRLRRGNVRFPDPTPSNPDFYNFLHLALRDKENRLKDVLFTDTSGEVFLQWSRNKDDENANSARWIHSNASCFILFVDCEALISRRSAAKTEIIDIAQQLKQDLNARPVVVVWSKADEIKDVKEVIKTSLKEDLKEIFPYCIEIEVANFSQTDPDNLCHENNLKVVDQLLEDVLQSSNMEINLNIEAKDDLFFSYRG
jgi:GTPase SAR1 family protein